MTWTVQQTGTTFTGTVALTDTSSGATGRGRMSGEVSATAFTFTASVDRGGFDPPYDGCSADIRGSGVVSSSTLSADYEGMSSCSGPITSGRLTLARQ